MFHPSVPGSEVFFVPCGGHGLQLKSKFHHPDTRYPNMYIQVKQIFGSENINILLLHHL